MARIFITGSTDGLGRLSAEALLNAGHEVVTHARNEERASAVDDLADRGAGGVIGDLSDRSEVLRLARDAARVGPFDAIIHNAGVFSGPALLPVNVVAPYLLSALLPRPARLVFLSSGMHLDGDASPEQLAAVDWSGERVTASYSTTKLYVTALTMALSDRWPDTVVSAVDPGWMPTKMGGPSAPGDLRRGHDTQDWLATSTEPEALRTGQYWHVRKTREPHPAARDTAFQHRMLAALERETGVTLPE